MAALRQPDWAEWRPPEQPFTVGVEEEVMLLDPADWALHQRFADVRDELSSGLAGRLEAETHGATIELETAPQARACDAAAELVAIRERLAAELAGEGLAAAGSGAHPFSTWEETELTEARRYRYVHETMRELARREPTFALHVHVAVPSCEQAVTAANRMRAHLPLLLALSANSPFWQGRDSGMASARTPIFQAFPRVGIPRRFAGYDDYVQTLETLIACGAFPEPTFVWWDLRLQPRFGTIEIRIMDVQTDPWRSMALAALVQALVRLESLEGHAPAELIEAPELLDENRFLAARDGVRAELLDPVTRRATPVAELIEPLLAACRPHAEEVGCATELDQVAELVDEPADELQRELAGPEHDLRRLVGALSERFSSPPLAAADRSPARIVAPPQSR
jgi:carboxylate-amine ligase